MLFAFFHWSDIYTNGTKSEVGKIANVFAVAPNRINIHCVLHHHTLAETKWANFSY